MSPVTRDLFEANKAHELGDDFGYFIYEFDSKKPASNIEILAKAASYDAALRLIDLYFLATSSLKPKTNHPPTPSRRQLLAKTRRASRAALVLPR